MISIYAQESGSLQYDFVWYKFAPAYKCSGKKKNQFDNVAQVHILFSLSCILDTMKMS